MTTLKNIKDKVDSLASQIDAPTDLLPTYGYSKDFGYPHIEIDDLGRPSYVIVERGQEIERRTTNNIDDLLYWVFSSVTFSMATNFELKNRIEDKDSRRLIFEKQEELLGILNKTWSQKESEKHRLIISKYPFDDLAGLRATYSGQLRQQGVSETEILRLGFQKYPTG